MTEEPAKKRLKILDDVRSKCAEIENYMQKIKTSNNRLTPVIDNCYLESIPVVKVCVGTITDPKHISETIATLNEKLPIKELKHLKRVKKRDILLCTQDALDGNTIQEHLSTRIGDMVRVFEGFKELEVPCSPPKAKWQYDEANEIWPCNFHANKNIEKLISREYFTDEELKEHREYMTVVFEVAKYFIINRIGEELDKINVALVVDPAIQSVVAISINNKSHPIQHAAMLAIDNVAMTQDGGVGVASRKKPSRTHRGIDEDLYCHLTDIFSELKFGARRFKRKRNKAIVDVKIDSCRPYLCTGYDIYMMRETCLMCSMALVHARVKRVFFCFPNGTYGALISKIKLQTVAPLNHHFEVFTGFN